MNLWVETYRPKTISDCVLPKKYKNIFQGYINNKELPNLLFYGSAGIGKTTVAKCLANELHTEVLFIDASSNNGKAMIETNIIPYAETVSIVNSDLPKIIILDEADGLTFATQQSFRPVIEQYAKQVRFIFTCNYVDRLIDPLKSRCSVFDFSIKESEKPELLCGFLRRMKSILNKENITDIDENALKKFIVKKFPDYRRIINEVQSYVNGANKIDDGLITSSNLQEEIGDILWEIIKSKNFDNMRKWINESLFSSQEIIDNLYKTLEKDVEKEKQPLAIILLAQYQEYSSHVLNQKINLLACTTELSQLF